MSTRRRSLVARILAGAGMVAACSPALAADAQAGAPAAAGALEDQFRDPPASARPRVWWHWMNGNISKEGIARDLAWMKRIGIGGAQTFDANLQTPQVVDHRLVYMTPEWKDAFRFAASEAERLGLELAIASSPGWSETGGPWVKPEDGLKKLVWTSVEVAGGQHLRAPLPVPPDRAGPFQDLPPGLTIEELITGHPAPDGPRHAGAIGVYAFAVAAAPALPAAHATDGLGRALDAAKLDGQSGEGVTLERKAGEAPAITLTYAKPATVRAATVFLPNMAVPFAGASYLGVIEASSDGASWRQLATVTLGPVPTTASFAPVTASVFRLVLQTGPGRAGLGNPAPGVALPPMEQMMAGALAARPLVVRTFALSAEPRIDRFETKAGFVISPDYYALPTVADAATGVTPGQVLDLTDRLRPDGTLDWAAPRLPRGQVWRVLRLGWSLLGTTNHPATPEATGLEVDKYDAAAVRAYLDHYLGMYRDAAGPDLIGARGVRALLTDSIEVGEANWTPQMIAQFQRLRGYDPRPWLPALTGTLIGSRAESDRFLYDYRRTLADLLASEHYGTVAKVAHDNGLIVYGEALEDHRPMLGDDMAMRRHADVPMAALWTFNREDGPRQTLIADMKGAASVAHLYGQNLVAAESMTSAAAPWAFAPKDLKRFIDLEFVTGINRPVIHTSVHVPVEDKHPGLSLFVFGQYFNRNESWAGLARPWVDYIARSSLLLQQGRNLADVAYFHGEEAPLTSLYGDKPVADAPRRYGYDFVNADALTGLLATDGTDVVSPAGARYKAIYLGGSSRYMTLATLRRLAALVEAGATVIGPAPLADPGRGGEVGAFAGLVARLWPGGDEARIGAGRVIVSRDVEGTLARLGVAPDLHFIGASADADLPFIHRTGPAGDIYFVVNRKAAPEQVTAHFRVTGKAPALWHPETGTSEPLSYRIEGGETVVPLSVGAEDSAFVVFREPAAAPARTVPAPALQPIAALDDAWSVAFEPDRGAPATLPLAKLAPLDTSADPGVRYFSGVATYTRSFALPRGARPGAPLWLDLGQVGDLAAVQVNGIDVGTAWHAPYRLDIGKAVRRGQNRMEIKVANTWVNRLIGDAQPGAQQDGKRPITWTAMPTYRADAPLRPAGLIGPVRLLMPGN